MPYVRLSHPLRVGDPGWPGNPTLSLRPFSQISAGHVANTYVMELFNHFGTHVDAPNHFNPDGPPLSQLPVERFVFERPVVLNLPRGADQLITRDDLLPHADRIQAADLLLLRTGFEAERTLHPVTYAYHGPGVHSDAATFLVQECPRLRAIGLDFISLSAYAHREDGYRAHRILTGAVYGLHHTVLIFEDMHLADCPPHLHRVWALPLFVEGVDSAPCTVIGEV